MSDRMNRTTDSYAEWSENRQIYAKTLKQMSPEELRKESISIGNMPIHWSLSIEAEISHKLRMIRAEQLSRNGSGEVRQVKQVISDIREHTLWLIA